MDANKGNTNPLHKLKQTAKDNLPTGVIQFAKGVRTAAHDAKIRASELAYTLKQNPTEIFNRNAEETPSIKNELVIDEQGVLKLKTKNAMIFLGATSSNYSENLKHLDLTQYSEVFQSMEDEKNLSASLNSALHSLNKLELISFGTIPKLSVFELGLDNVQNILIQKLALHGTEEKLDFSKCSNLKQLLIANIDTALPEIEIKVKKGVKVITPPNVKVKIIEVD